MLSDNIIDREDRNLSNKAPLVKCQWPASNPENTFRIHTKRRLFNGAHGEPIPPMLSDDNIYDTTISLLVKQHCIMQTTPNKALLRLHLEELRNVIFDILDTRGIGAGNRRCRGMTDELERDLRENNAEMHTITTVFCAVKKCYMAERDRRRKKKRAIEKK